MKGSVARDGLHLAAQKVNEAAREIRSKASSRLGRFGNDRGKKDKGPADFAADVLGAVSESLEAVADGARDSGLAIHDRGRDASRSAARGERVLRESGVSGAAVRTGGMVKRNAARIALAGAGLAAFLAFRRKSESD